MVSNWDETTLQNILSISTTKIDRENVSLDSYISTDNMLPDFGGVTNAEKIPSVKKVTAYTDRDILFSNIRTYFKKLWFADKSGGCSNDVIVFKVKKGVCPKFAFYSLMSESFIQYTVQTSKGTKMPRGDKVAMKQYSLLLPTFPEQKAIAHILGTLDDKIELNRQMNETLEAMAQALFKGWFVDFDPVIDNALLAGNDIPDELAERAELRQSQLDSGKANINSEINYLFPNEFEFIEGSGWIPKGWEVARLDKMFELQRGFDLPKKKRTDGLYPLMAASGQDGTHNEFKVEGPGVVTGRSGKLGVVSFVQSNFWPLNTTLWLKNYNYSNPYHAYFFLKTLDLEKYNSGSAVPSLNRNNVHNLQQVISPKLVLDKFKDLVKNNFDKIETNNSQSNTLAKLRDTLLPKLMSGELRIPDAEKLVADI